MNKKYTPEQVQYISDNIKGRSFRDLTDMFNQQFGLGLKVSAMISLADRHGLHNGRDARFNTGHEPTQFRKGMTPWNKGMKGGKLRRDSRRSSKRAKRVGTISRSVPNASTPTATSRLRSPTPVNGKASILSFGKQLMDRYQRGMW